MFNLAEQLPCIEIDQLSPAEWMEQYQPINKDGELAATLEEAKFKIHGEDIKQVFDGQREGQQVWTLVQQPGGKIWISSGFVVINRIGHFLTERKAANLTEVFL